MSTFRFLTSSNPETDEHKPKGSLWNYLTSREFGLSIGIILGGGVLFFLFIFTLLLPWITRHNDTVEVPDVSWGIRNQKFSTLQSAIQTLESQGLHPVVKDSEYVAEVPALMVLRQDPVGLSLVKPGRKVYLTVSKAVPPTVKLPDILETSLQQGVYQLENWGIKVGKINYVSGDAPDLIYNVYYKGKEIKPGTDIRKGASVDLKVSKGVGILKVALPDVVDMQLEDALELLESVGLNGRVARRTLVPDVRPDIVVNQSPDNYDSVYTGTTIDLEISGDEFVDDE